jgi:hypothetical protein
VVLRCLVELERRMLELDDIQDRLVEKDAPISRYNIRIRTSSNEISGEITQARPIRKVQSVATQQVLFGLMPERITTRRVKNVVSISHLFPYHMILAQHIDGETIAQPFSKPKPER